MTTTETDRETLSVSKGDLAALKLAMDIAMAKDEGTRRQLKSMLEDRSWLDVAKFAAYCLQYDALNLKPWEWPPCWADEDDDDDKAALLLRRMLAKGISRYHPDPLGALERSQRTCAFGGKADVS